MGEASCREVFYRTKIEGLSKLVAISNDPVIVLSAGLRIIEEVSGYIYECFEGNLVYDYMDWEWTVIDRIKRKTDLYAIYSEILDAIFNYVMGFEVDLEYYRSKILEALRVYGF